ncbi:MAG: DUF805 domain-containing protein [Streptococcus hyointestinalis]|nr:DUF805 domain-containing protein [Streptococcus hyointestinalis]MDD6385286.1 DUF805 domain-containing protein [Streptococcus hyointestinalis]
MLVNYKSFWTHYLDFKGRTCRSHFWLIVLINSLISLSFFFLIATLAFGLPQLLYLLANSGNLILTEQSFQSTWARLLPLILLGVAFLSIWFLFILVPSVALQVRRLRDAGFHSAFILLLLGDFATFIIPLGWIIMLGCRIALLVFYCLPSKKESH